jgi:hypothetical protein
MVTPLICDLSLNVYTLKTLMKLNAITVKSLDGAS